MTYPQQPWTPPPAPKPKKSHRLRWTLLSIVGAVLVLAIVGTAIGGTNGSTKNTADTQQVAESVAPSTSQVETVTVTASPTASAKKAQSRHVSAAETPSSTHHAKSPAGGSNDDGSFTMPNEVGNILQVAQDDVQRVSEDPIFFTHSHDLLGDRFQLLDSDWQVCTQNVPPGTHASWHEHIDFGVVKVYENCP